MSAIPGGAVFRDPCFGTFRNYRGGSIINPKSACRIVRLRNAPKQSSMLTMDSRFWGKSLKLQQASSQGRCHIWRSDGLGLTPNLRVAGATMSLSLLPEKPVGLYDPSFEKDSCGVGFVAELSGESRRKTVGSPVFCHVSVVTILRFNFINDVNYTGDGCIGNVDKDVASGGMWMRGKHWGWCWNFSRTST